MILWSVQKKMILWYTEYNNHPKLRSNFDVIERATLMFPKKKRLIKLNVNYLNICNFYAKNTQNKTNYPSIL